MNRLITVVTFSILLIAGTVYAHSGATGVVKKRMDAMGDMGDKSKIVADMYKRKIEFDRAALSEAADAFVMHGANMVEMFPDTEHSRTGSKTEALPRIWDEWDAFNTLATKFVTRSEALQETIASTEDATLLKKAFFQTTKSCSACHKRFRKPKE